MSEEAPTPFFFFFPLLILNSPKLFPGSSDGKESAMGRHGVLSLGWKDFLEKEMSSYSSILAWRIPGTEQAGRLQRVRHDQVTFTFFKKNPPKEEPLISRVKKYKIQEKTREEYRYLRGRQEKGPRKRDKELIKRGRKEGGVTIKPTQAKIQPKRIKIKALLIFYLATPPNKCFFM